MTRIFLLAGAAWALLPATAFAQPANPEPATHPATPDEPPAEAEAQALANSIWWFTASPQSMAMVGWMAGSARVMLPMSVLPIFSLSSCSGLNGCLPSSVAARR